MRPGVQVVTAKPNELYRVLGELDPDDLDQLDPLLGEWMRRILGRQTLVAIVLPTSGSVFVALNNIEPAGFIFVERSQSTVHVRAWAVIPDMRGLGIATAMLKHVETHARERGVRWLYMLVKSDNTSAIKTALASGFKRYLPQYLVRESSAILPINTGDVHVEPADERALGHWFRSEINAGDAWAAEMITRDLQSLFMPTEGAIHKFLIKSRDIGAMRLAGTNSHPALWLWLEPEFWNSEIELNCLRAGLNILQNSPDRIELYLGSFDHMRLSLAQLKKLGFKPALKTRWLMLKSL
jgi:GNAT superfamily N-acetyltransferase